MFVLHVSREVVQCYYNIYLYLQCMYVRNFIMIVIRQ